MDNVMLLGTSSAFPTKERNHPALYMSLDGKRVLFDCGEGTQRQIRVAGLSPSIDYMFLTHWHGDHSLGVGGIIQSLNMMRRKEQLYIYGPQGTGSSVNHILATYRFHSEIQIKAKSLDLKKETFITKIGRFSVYGINVMHTTKCIGYKIKEDDQLNIKHEFLKKNKIKSGVFLQALKKGKDIVYEGKKFLAKEATYLKRGKSLVYLTDLGYDKNLYRFARGADVLVIESTWSSEFENQAKEFGHLTARQALEVAKYADVGKVYLTHFSQRYEDMSVFKEELSDIVKKLKLKPKVFVSNDFERINF